MVFSASQLFFWAGSSFLVGAALTGFGFSLHWFWWLLFFCGIFFRGRGFSVYQLSYFLVFGLLGVFYFHTFGVIKDQAENLPQGDTDFRVVVSGDAQKFDRVQAVPVVLVEPYQGEVKLLTSPLTDFQFGNEWLVVGQVNPRPWPEENLVTFPTLRKVEESPKWSVQLAALRFRDQHLRNFQLTFRSDEAALLGGLVFGSRGDFSPELREAMRRTGTTHLVALSGYNIGILLLAIRRMLRGYLSRKLFLGANILFVSLFLLMVGGGSSITRAALMGLLTLLALESGRSYSFRQATLFAALLMTVYNPSLISHDLGFQLSFLSFLGIAFLEPLLSDFFGVTRKRSSWFQWRENLSTTLAAQLGVLPVLLVNFGLFSLTSVLANILILWIVPLIMGLGFSLAATYWFSPQLGFIFQPALQLSLVYALSVISLSATLPVFHLVWPWWSVPIYYVLLGLLIYKTQHNETQ